MQRDSNHDIDRQSPAERLYAEFLRAGDEDDPVAFDAFIDAHAEHRAALERIWNVDRVLRPDSSSFFYRPEYAARHGLEEGVEIAELGPGATLGPYELLRKIGQGGMGQVWEAREHGLERSVALKLINPGRVSQRTLEYFHREARAGARVRHPGVVTLYAAGEIEACPTWPRS